MQATSIFEEVMPQPNMVETGVLEREIAQDTGFAAEEVTDDVRETRYLFNPFMVCELGFFAAPIGYPYLPNGQFIRIGSVIERKNTPDYEYIPKSPYASNTVGERNTRYAGHITNDLIDTYSSFGVAEITALRGVDDQDFIDSLSVELLGENIPTRTDIYYQDRPCPVLPLWFEQIEANYRNMRDDYSASPNTAGRVKVLDSIFANLQAAFVRASEVATAITQKAIGKSLNPSTANKQFDPLERRAFHALGQDIPDRLPTVTQNANERAAKVEDAFLAIAANASQPVVSPAAETNAVLEAVLEQNRMLTEQASKQNERIDLLMNRFADAPAAENKAVETVPPVIAPKEEAKPNAQNSANGKGK